MDTVNTQHQVLYGRSFLKLNIINGKIRITVEDPQDILVGVFVCDNLSFNGDFKPMLTKHTANVNLHKCSLFRSDYEKG